MPLLPTHVETRVTFKLAAIYRISELAVRTFTKNKTLKVHKKT